MDGVERQVRGVRPMQPGGLALDVHARLVDVRHRCVCDSLRASRFDRGRPRVARPVFANVKGALGRF